MSKVSVIGLGYIGLPTAIILANNGHEVYGYDINENVIMSLRNGKIHIVENNLQEAYSKAIKSRNLSVSNELLNADIYIIAVPTPIKLGRDNNKIANLDYIVSAAKAVSKVLKKGDLVILESTVPPGTTKMMTIILEENSLLSSDDFFTAHCPERVLPGNILFELENNDRIIGSDKPEAAEIAKNFYKSFVKKGHIHISDDITAEMAKLVENTSRDIDIAFANELSIICDSLGIDVFELIKLANKHPRVNILTPGVGVGGHCLAVDPWFIVEKFPRTSKIIAQARKTNDYKPIWVSEKIEQMIKNDKNVMIGILGLAYKPNIDDLRESPSIELGLSLIKKGYNVIACEPNSNEKILKGILNVNLETILSKSDFLVLTLAHKEFIEKINEIKKRRYYDCVGVIK